jgi:hypothetical protein
MDIGIAIILGSVVIFGAIIWSTIMTSFTIKKYLSRKSDR